MRSLKIFLKSMVPQCLLMTVRWIWVGMDQIRQSVFDRRFGVDTSGFVEPDKMDVDIRRSKCGTRYMATPHGVFLRVLRSIEIDFHRFTFVDIGSGKGAVLLYASEFPFRSIIGVEYSARLNEIAEKNIRNFRNSRIKCKFIITLCMDALAYSLPNEPLILYLYNPFTEDMLKRVVSKIECSLTERPRDLIVMSYNPTVEEVLDRTTCLRRIRTGWNHAIYRSKFISCNA